MVEKKNKENSIEVWKNIPNFEDYYEINNFGKIKSKRKKLFLKTFIGRGGYPYVLLKSNKYYNNSLHRLLMIVFKPIENMCNLQVNHIDGNKLNYNLDNLEWTTKSENMQHSYKVLNRKGVNVGRFGILNKNSKKVKQLDFNGNLIKIWDSLSDYERFSGKRASDISAVLAGKQKTAHGYKWELIKIKLEEIDE